MPPVRATGNTNTPAVRRARVLFVGEAVTLAHVARPVTLAQKLDSERYEVTVAADPRYGVLFPELTCRFRPIHSISSERFLDSLARGRPVYDVATLREYVREDLEVIREVDPDVIVGDFRLSLSISARLTGRPYVAISNAYWSPYAPRRFPMPEFPLTALGLPIARAVFALVRPVGFSYHALPLSRVRREYGLRSLGLDLRRVYTDADAVLYADVPELTPLIHPAANQHFLGPVIWSPAGQLPAWWSDIPSDKPSIYVTLGSSGRKDLLRTVVDALADLPVTVLGATAGRTEIGAVPANARVAAFLPGTEAAARSALVVCNGGSPTTQQALSAGRPVLGLASNMDQHLNMGAIARFGAGELLRADTADGTVIRATVVRMLGEPRYAVAAATVAKVFASYDAQSRFEGVLAQYIGQPERRGFAA